MEAVSFFETLVLMTQSTRCRIPGNRKIEDRFDNPEDGGRKLLYVNVQGVIPGTNRV